MSNNFEKLKNTLLNFLSKQKKFKITKSRRDLEESSILLEYSDKVQMKYSSDNEPEKNSLAMITSANRIPFLFGLLGTLLMIVMICLSIYKKFEADEVKLLYVEIGLSKVKFLNFFRLPTINKIVFHLINSSYSLAGIALVASLFHVLSIKLSNKKASLMQFFKLCLTISYGMMAQILNLVYGVIYLCGEIEGINISFMNETKISIFQFIFLIQIFFTLMFGTFTTIFISKLESKPAYSLEDHEYLDEKEGNNKSKWFNYKIIALFHLVFFSFIYVFVYLHHNKYILQNFTPVHITENYSYILAIFPFVLYIMNMMVYLMFYDELNESVFFISHTGEEAVRYQKIERNIL